MDDQEGRKHMKVMDYSRNGGQDFIKLPIYTVRINFCVHEFYRWEMISQAKSTLRKNLPKILNIKASKLSSSATSVNLTNLINFSELFYDKKISSNFHVNSRELEPLGVL